MEDRSCFFCMWSGVDSGCSEVNNTCDNFKLKVRYWPPETARIVGTVQPVRRSWIQRTMSAAQKQLSNRSNRDEAILTACTCGLVVLVMVACWVLFPAAVEQQMENNHQVVACSTNPELCR